MGRVRAVVFALLSLCVLVPRAGAEPKNVFAGDVLPTDPIRPNAEPGMAIDGGGTIWVSSFTAGHPPDPAGLPNDRGEVPGTGIWRSADGGRTYEWIIDPWKLLGEENPGLPLAGNDSDIAAAPQQNGFGHYNVYAVALYPSNASIAWSENGGGDWNRLPITGVTGFPFDRPWIAADGACTLYLAYRSGPTWFIQRYDFCDASRDGVSVDPVSSAPLPLGEDGTSVNIAKPQVDPRRHRLYLPMETCEEPFGVPNPLEGDEGGGCRGEANIAVAYSDDGADTWRVSNVSQVPSGAMPIWPATIALDDDGTVYISWFDERDAYLSRSDDGGKSWSLPAPVNTGEALTAAYPTVAATGQNTVAVAYYGTTRDGNANSEAVMKLPNARGSAKWQVYYALSFDDGRDFKTYVASPVVHTGVLCTHGGGCSIENSRNLFDDFGMVFTKDGRAAIAYTTDRVSVPGKTTGTLETTFTAYATEL